MWSVEVVVLLPCGDVGLCLGEGCEQRFIQQLIAEAANEALDEGILRWLSGRDVVPTDAGILAPSEDCHTGQFGSVIAYDNLGVASAHHDFGKLACDAHAGQ